MISDLLRVVPRCIIVVIILDSFRPAVIMQLASLGVKLRRSRYAEVITGRKITALALKELNDEKPSGPMGFRSPWKPINTLALRARVSI